jgi:hypothetical protein
MKCAALVLAPLPLQAMYTAAELARAIGISRRRLLRVLDAWGAYTVEVGTEVWVPMSELEGKLEPLWESILAAARADREIADRQKATRRNR